MAIDFCFVEMLRYSLSSQNAISAFRNWIARLIVAGALGM